MEMSFKLFKVLIRQQKYNVDLVWLGKVCLAND